MHGHRPRAASIPRSAERGDDPFPAFAFVRPLAGTARADEPRRARLRRDMPAGTGPDRVKVRAALSAGEAPPRTSSAHLVRRAGTATRGGSSRAFCPHRVFTPRERGVSHREASGSRIAPRRVVRSTKTEVRSAVLRLNEPEDCSPFSFGRASLPRSTCAPKNTDTLQIERTCAFSTIARCPA